MSNYKPGTEEVDNFYVKLKEEAEEGGYFLNPDESFTKALVEGLIVNDKRYGYRACPCRLAEGEKEDDLDIICPCDYRDPDLNDYDACFCGLYVSEAINNGEKKLKSLPDRRLKEKNNKSVSTVDSKLPYPVWRCKVCGYLCAREEAPLKCPVCKVGKERFERFM